MLGPQFTSLRTVSLIADFDLLLPFCIFLLHCSLSRFFPLFDLRDCFCWVWVTFSCKYVDF